LPSNPGKAIHQKTVPTVLFVDPTWPLKKKIKLKEEEQDKVNSYVPSTGSKTLVSYSSKQEEEDDFSTMMLNEQRDPFETQASAVKALMYGEDNQPVSSEGWDGIKCIQCRCVPCIWIQKGHLVQKKHEQEAKREPYGSSKRRHYPIGTSAGFILSR
jgi:hypothetical protein